MTDNSNKYCGYCKHDTEDDGFTCSELCDYYTNSHYQFSLSNYVMCKLEILAIEVRYFFIFWWQDICENFKKKR
jgi:hypothetical protein